MTPIPQLLEDAWALRMQARAIKAQVQKDWDDRKNLFRQASDIEEKFKENYPAFVLFAHNVNNGKVVGEKAKLILQRLKLDLQSPKYGDAYTACNKAEEEYFKNVHPKVVNDERKVAQAEDAPIVLKPVEKKGFCKKCTIL